MDNQRTNFEMVTSCKLLIINTQILRFFILFCLLLPGFVIFQKWQKFTIDQVIYAINGLRNSKKFTIARLFTIDRFTIARFDCTILEVSKILRIGSDSAPQTSQSLNEVDCNSESFLFTERRTSTRLKVGELEPVL